ncbi:MAG: HAMP domain-containing protein [Prevotella sp.]|nr:HAMP domain-containing protein [Prevotella sp.]
MNAIVQRLRQSLSLRLSLWILGIVVVIFIITIGFLFHRTKESVRQGAIDQASQMLNNNMQHLIGILNEIEVATDNSDWLVMQNLQPESILALSRQILELNPNLFGCSIAFVPNFFEDQGKYFSAYSSNDNGHLETEQEGNDDYNYFEMDWYKEPMKLQKPCWVDPFRDYSPDGIVTRDMIASYCKPLITADGRCIGVISSDISHRRLTQAFASEWIYQHSYYMLIGKSKQLIASSSEHPSVSDLDRSDCLVLQEEIPGTGWTLAFICPESDIFKEYNQMFYIIVSIILFGLLMILSLCYFVVHRTVAPIRLLASQARDIEKGCYDKRITRSSRKDEIGLLQNSFATMQQSIANYIANLQEMKAETEQRNEELIVAKNLAEESDNKKKAFIQDISHQIRTPLNIIGGFAQVLRDGYNMLGEDEKAAITKDILQNSYSISNIVNNWIMTLVLENTISIAGSDIVNCNDLCREAAASLNLKHPDTVKLEISTNLPDNLQIETNKTYVKKILEELLYNANKFTTNGSIAISNKQLDSKHICFQISDTGPGIPFDDRDRIFNQFTKLNNFNEGLGMGLYLCRHLAILLGGTLDLDITYTNGASFVLILPMG